MPRFLETKAFAKEVYRRNPRWNSPFWLPGYLEAFDEAGPLRPIFRVFMPQSYATYHEKPHMEPDELGLTQDEARLFRTVDRILFNSQPTAECYE